MGLGHRHWRGRPGNAYVTGWTGSGYLPPNFPTKNPLLKPSNGLYAFVSKINPMGSAFVYSTYLGGPNGGQGFAIAVDRCGERVTSRAEPASAGFPNGESLTENISPAGVSRRLRF